MPAANTPSPKHDSPRKARLIVLLCAIIISLIAGFTGFGAPLETVLHSVRDGVRSRRATGDVVVAAIDDKSMAEIGSWPWPRSTYARLSDRLRTAGARRMLFDVDFSSPSNPANDSAMAAAFARWKTAPVLAARFEIDPMTGRTTDLQPIPLLRAHAVLANVDVHYYFSGILSEMPYALSVAAVTYPSMSAMLANHRLVAGDAGRMYPLDFATRLDTIPQISISDLLDGRFDRRLIAGKQVIVGAVSAQLNDLYIAPGRGFTPGVLFHVLGYETLKHGTPIGLGWLWPLVAALGVSALAVWRGGRLAVAVPAAGLAAFLFAPFLLERMMIFVTVAPGLIGLGILAGGLGWQRLRSNARSRGLTNPISGLPNLEALRAETGAEARSLVVARIGNFAQIRSAMPPDRERLLVEQIVARLRLVDPLRLFQGEEGIFAWFVEGERADQLGGQLDALHSMFRNPAAVQGELFDLTINFGVDHGGDRSLTNRLGSALVAAGEAASEGLRWKSYDSARSADASWKLSLLGQLDAAIDDGGLWVAYQPKLDLATRRIVGAEALVRWTHPEKGPISPDEFIPAAEKSNRIERLTIHVLDRAVEAAAAINAQGIPFGIAVNLSARLLDDDAILAQIESVLARYRLDPARLTLEVTETANLLDNATVGARLVKLRTLGVHLSIDDYGTGLSTLEYLKMIPADEIKIDKSFVMAMGGAEGDRMIVRSTIELAHSLGRKVVAEGVEDEATLEALAAAECDVAQGYFIGRPMPFTALAERLHAQEKQLAA